MLNTHRDLLERLRVRVYLAVAFEAPGDVPIRLADFVAVTSADLDGRNFQHAIHWHYGRREFSAPINVAEFNAAFEDGGYHDLIEWLSEELLRSFDKALNSHLGL